MAAYDPATVYVTDPGAAPLSAEDQARVLELAAELRSELGYGERAALEAAYRRVCAARKA